MASSAGHLGDPPDYMAMRFDDEPRRMPSGPAHNPSMSERLNAGLARPIPATNKGHQMLYVGLQGPASSFIVIVRAGIDVN